MFLVVNTSLIANTSSTAIYVSYCQYVFFATKKRDPSREMIFLVLLAAEQ